MQIELIYLICGFIGSICVILTIMVSLHKVRRAVVKAFRGDVFVSSFEDDCEERSALEEDTC